VISRKRDARVIIIDFEIGGIWERRVSEIEYGIELKWRLHAECADLLFTVFEYSLSLMHCISTLSKASPMNCDSPPSHDESVSAQLYRF
jgi:hypothetical protein